MTEPISQAAAEYAARVQDRGPFRPERPTLSPQEPIRPASAFEVDPLKGKVEVPATRQTPVSPGRLGAVNAAILQNLPSAIDHIAALAASSSDLEVRLDASKLILAVAGMRTPAALVEAAKVAMPTALTSLTVLACGKIAGAERVAVDAAAALVAQLKA